MFNFFRQHQKLMQLVLLILILPSFVLIGVSGYSSYVSGDVDIVKVGDQAVTSQEFDMARRNQLNEMQRTMGGAFDPELVDTLEAKQQLLNALVDRRVLIEIATKERFSVSDSALRSAIAAMPELQEEGVFSPQRYNQLLAGAGIASKDFEQSQRAELALNRVIEPVVRSAFLPPVISDALKQVLTESRTIQLHRFHVDGFLSAQHVNDEEITQWYESHQEQLRLPDYINADFIVLNEAAAIKNVPAIQESDLQAYYEQNKSRFLTPARIHLSHILINPGSNDTEHQAAQQRAKELAQKAQANPEQFADLAKAESQDVGSASSGGELGWVTYGNWPDVLQNAVFALKKGEVSGVIEGPDGYHIFKANDFQTEQSQDFESVRAAITDEVRQQLAADQFAEMATELTNLVYEHPESLAAAADALGVTVLSAKGIARDRLLSKDDIGEQDNEYVSLLDDVRVRRALYAPGSIEQKQNAGVIELSSDTLVAVRVNDFVASHIPALDQVRARVKQQLLHDKALAAAQAAGVNELNLVLAGSEPTVSFSESIEISRINTQQLPKETLDTIMRAETSSLPTYIGVNNNDGYLLVKIVAKETGSPDPMIEDFLTMQLQQLWSNAQEHVFMQALREQLQVKELAGAKEALNAELED